MMLLITYNKNDNTATLENLHIVIKNNSISWWHHLNDTWIVRTDKKPNEFYNKLAPYITSADRLLVIEIKRNYQGWLNKDAWDWLKKEFKNDSLFGL
ncbi:hypothetical protein [Runella zeae]|uniref:hypothetical protein n=1 Tax=Runella zeae TaxID=94255 RepID=UPI002355B81A|nr:hypothetical protein [Runella zeae]